MSHLKGLFQELYFVFVFDHSEFFDQVTGGDPLNREGPGLESKDVIVGDMVGFKTDPGGATLDVAEIRKSLFERVLKRFFCQQALTVDGFRGSLFQVP